MHIAVIITHAIVIAMTCVETLQVGILGAMLLYCKEWYNTFL